MLRFCFLCPILPEATSRRIFAFCFSFGFLGAGGVEIGVGVEVGMGILGRWVRVGVVWKGSVVEEDGGEMIDCGSVREQGGGGEIDGNNTGERG